MKIALVHDHLVSDGGGEKVLKAFSEIWPQAPIYTLVYDSRRTNPFFISKDIRTSYLQNLPLKSRKYQWYLPLRPKAVESIDLSGYDVVLSNSSSLIKGVKTPDATLHIDYCHTPTRFLWVDPDERLDPLEGYWPISYFSRRYKERLKHWDLEAVSRVNSFITNSENVSRRIKYHYKQDATVIYPPVETDKFHISQGIGDYFLVGGRITSYKRFDMVIDAFNRTLLPLKIFGVGPWLRSIRRRAKGNIEFLGQVSDQDKAELYANAKAFIYPQVEDFGITAIESMASGRPVLAYKEGGSLETVVPGQTGEFFNDQDWNSLADMLIRFSPGRYDPQRVRQHAEKFSADRFKMQIKDYVQQAWQNHKKV